MTVDESNTTDQQLILLENMQSQLQLLAEGQIQLKTGLMAEIASRYERLEGKIHIVELAVNRNAGEIKKNRRAIEGNTHAIQENRRVIEGNTRAIQENSRAVEGNTRAIQGNSRDIQGIYGRLDQMAERFSYYDREIQELKAH